MMELSTWLGFGEDDVALLVAIEDEGGRFLLEDPIDDNEGEIMVADWL